MPQVNIFDNPKKTVSFVAGQAIFRQGDAGDIMYGVVNGEVDLIIQDKVIETVKPGGVYIMRYEKPPVPPSREKVMYY